MKKVLIAIASFFVVISAQAKSNYSQDMEDNLMDHFGDAEQVICSDKNFGILRCTVFFPERTIKLECDEMSCMVVTNLYNYDNE